MFSGENLGVSVLHQMPDLLEDDFALFLTSRNVSAVPVRTCGASGGGHRDSPVCAVPISAGAITDPGIAPGMTAFTDQLVVMTRR